LKRSGAAHIKAVSINADASELVYRQLYFSIRDAMQFVSVLMMTISLVSGSVKV
jgi:hypothetical protein